MKRIARQFSYPAALVVAVVLLAFVVFASPNSSWAASPKSRDAAGGKISKTDRVEERIKDLHTKLKITPAQEESWNKVTQVMRDNAKTMDALIEARAEKAGTMNAVEDFKSYAEITEAHTEGLKKFIEVFEPFYASMSEAQKKNADTLFRHHGRTKSKAKVK